MSKKLILLPLLAFALNALPQVGAKHSDPASKLTGFLGEYMPLCDLADYPTPFIRANAAMTLRAMREMPWGKMVNDTLMHHFVLPIRVNNEPLDSFRILCYDELAERVKGLTMTEAAIAINHWCHEKVTYQPTDGRTSSPLQCIRTAYGRCGEESTLCVAAMRTVGIPARQVYTPRWAHCDDNHAWVEVWTDGKWHFLGACEPEPTLDLGWFNAPASRGMLMHTRVFGDYKGPEDVVRRVPTFTEINVTSNYAQTRRVFIRVTENGRPVEGAQVEFKIYNYAEFFSAVTRTTDAEGMTSLVSGLGDLLVWASKDGRFGYRKVDFAHDTTVTIELTYVVGDMIAEDIDVHVPQANYTLPVVTPAMRSENDLALAREDSLRHAYERTMPTLPEQATERDSLLWKSRGNSAVIRAFLDKYGESGMPLLRTLSDKDLRDVTSAVLEDHQQLAARPMMTQAYIDHILAPRVALEPLKPWRSVLKSAFDFKSVEEVRQWCDSNLTLIADRNRNGTYITPLGVLFTRECDQRSRDVFFVCLCRAMGFEAWLDPVTGEVKTESGDGGTNVIEETVAQSNLNDFGTIRFTGDPSLGYINRFTVSRLTPEGTLSLLTFPEEAPLGTLEPKDLPVGTYVLTTGTRQRNGDVLATIRSFRIEAGKETVVCVVPREDIDTATVFGHLDGTNGAQVIALIAEGHEPSNHVVRDICLRHTEFDRAGIPVRFVFASDVQLAKFRPQDFAPLPALATFTTDDGGTLAESLSKALPLHNASNLPLVVLVDTHGDIRYYHQGYTIGIGDALLKATE